MVKNINKNQNSSDMTPAGQNKKSEKIILREIESQFRNVALKKIFKFNKFTSNSRTRKKRRKAEALLKNFKGGFKARGRNRKQHFSAKQTYNKYFIWKNCKNLSSIKRYKTQQLKKRRWFNFYRPQYKKIKINNLLKKNNVFRRQINTRLLRRLRARVYNYKFQIGSQQRFHRRRKAFIQKKYINPLVALFSWCSKYANSGLRKQYIPVRNQLFNLKKTKHFWLTNKPNFDRKTFPFLGSKTKFKEGQKQCSVTFLKLLKNHPNFYRNICEWTNRLELFPLYFSILLKKWKVSREFKNKNLLSNRFNAKSLSHLRRNSLVRSQSRTTKFYCGKRFLLRKLLQNIPRTAAKDDKTSHKRQYNSSKQLYKALIFVWTNQHNLSYHIVSNILNFKRIYKHQYKISLIEQTQYILKNKYRDFGSKSLGKLLKGSRIQRRKYPWLPQMISKKRAYSLQYFNFYRSLRTPWTHKSNKVYRTFMAVTKHRHEKVKLKLGTRGGHRHIYFKLNLLKVILPFYGKLNTKQFGKIWHQYIYIKSHHQGRAERFYNKLNTTLCVLIQELGWAPNTYWAQNLIKNGWISISEMNEKTKLKAYSSQQLFPLLNNTRTKIKPTFQTNAIRNPFHQVKSSEVIQIHPYIKTFCKQFFLRRLNWNRKQVPNFMEVDSHGANARIANSALYYTVNTKNRNRKFFLRYILD